MAKVKTIYACTSCGATSPKWVGKCNHCGEWNTYIEEVISKDTATEAKDKAWRAPETASGNRPVPLPEIKAGDMARLVAPDEELNRVLGGGIVPGSLVLIGGQPGIGKSTLLLQLALHIPVKILYVSGEESEEQIKMRADRIGGQASNCYILAETNTSKLLKHAQNLKPDLLIIDSIQTLSSPHIDSMPGSVSQVRECAGELQRFAKESHIPVFIIGHITKEGSIAGPKLLEHIVDAVLQFEGDRNYTYRILRTIKNRFGSTDELGIYEMQANGLREVSNPSELLLSQNEEDLSGSAIAATIEGMRPMLIETQALVSTSVYSSPQRSATGFDLRRLNMLLAVLEKRVGLPFAQNDVFLNIAGGLRVDDPAIDLAIVSALISSLEDVGVPTDVCFAGEVGLSGEIRTVNRIEQRIQEADRLGFKEIYISKYNTKGLDRGRYEIEVKTVAKVQELYFALFK
ncbi:DNA repair protein RadA [Phaeodactylibacter luteus]|uniref:DNA repair protein RadA n=1 Tax=Phaeodactylibacter luteus TaxID=1564516 RepID=A0A5C6RM07_9BACT|nr:DNA repair protein RadA [Phaeodactylibacter luteus]TXB63366.1 DNA repair protein RadA [Phaeodactylibacter luteus]